METKEESASGAAPPDDLRVDDGAPFRGAGSHIKHSIEEQVRILIATSVKIADAGQGRDQLKSLMSSAFEGKFGGVIQRLQRALQEDESELARVKEALEQAIADCLSPLKLCHYLFSSGVYEDGTKETFRRRYIEAVA